MKKRILAISFAVFALMTTAGHASAQNYDRRVDAARAAADEARAYRPDQEHWDRGDGERRAAHDLDRLNRVVRALRLEIEDSRRAGQHIRDRFHRVKVAADRLNNAYERGLIRPWDVRQRADAIRADLDEVRREVRERYRRPR